MSKAKDPRLARAGVDGFNKPKRTPNHDTKSNVVVAKEGDNMENRGQRPQENPRRVNLLV